MFEKKKRDPFLASSVTWRGALGCGVDAVFFWGVAWLPACRADDVPRIYCLVASVKREVRVESAVRCSIGRRDVWPQGPWGWGWRWVPYVDIGVGVSFLWREETYDLMFEPPVRVLSSTSTAKLVLPTEPTGYEMSIDYASQGIILATTWRGPVLPV